MLCGWLQRHHPEVADAALRHFAARASETDGVRNSPEVSESFLTVYENLFDASERVGD
jgi:hypothetical protein